MNATINQAKAEYLYAKDRLANVLKNTPDDRLNWSPSPSARTPLQQVAHAADAIGNIHNMLDGRPFQVPTSGEADKGFREWESRFTAREEVLQLLEEKGSAYAAFLDTLTEKDLDNEIIFPFGLGRGTVLIGLGAVPMHTNHHAAQIEYIQTIYGDRDWHL